jgi:hypothetical protein
MNESLRDRVVLLLTNGMSERRQESTSVIT